MSEQTLNQLVEHVRTRYYGKYAGTVVDNADTTGRWRVKVSVPAVLGDVEIWAEPCVPYAGPSVGFCFSPPADAGVWVEFEGGDPSRPIWTGCYWADTQLPTTATPGVKLLRTERLEIKLDDDAQQITISVDDGASVIIDTTIIADAGAKVTISSDSVLAEKGSTKTEVADAGFTVNDGALEVT